jgi:hypothetical protein
MKKLFVLSSFLLCALGLFAQGLDHGSYLGGTGVDIAHGVEVGPFGEMFTAGHTNSPNFPVLNAYQPKLAGEVNAFVTKVNANGSLGWSTYLGGSQMDGALALVTDRAGNVYVTGSTNSPNFPVTAGVVQPQLVGAGNNAFVAKFNSSGSLVWSTYLAGSTSQGNGIALDGSGNIFVAGNQQGPGGLDGFVIEINPTATKIIFSTTLGGNGIDSIQSIALLGEEAYVAGYTNSTDFPTTPGALQRSCGSACADFYNGFVAELGANGVAYATYLGGTKTEANAPKTTLTLAIGIAVDASGDAYVTGTTNTIDFPVTSGAFQTQYGGTTDLPGGLAGCIDFISGRLPCGDAYAVKLNPTGTHIDWATYLGGSTADIGYAIQLDSSSHVWVGGYTQSYACPQCQPPLTGFPVTTNAYQPVKAGGLDCFVSELSSTGKSLIYSTYFGGTHDEEAFGFDVDALGFSAYIAGRTTSPNLPVTPDAFQKNFAGQVNAFVARIQP